MKVILLNWTGAVINNRIGVANTKAVRPLRIELPNVNIKKEALGNCRNLKEMAVFKHISVRKDLIKKEQEEWKTKAKENAGMRTRGSKRKLTEAFVNPSRAKFLLDYIRWTQSDN